MARPGTVPGSAGRKVRAEFGGDGERVGGGVAEVGAARLKERCSALREKTAAPVSPVRPARPQRRPLMKNRPQPCTQLTRAEDGDFVQYE